jgi:predicted negative regulator of RcsB-dependent stress response
MNRPKKNTPDNPLLPKDQQLDERNIIDLEDSAELSFEDRVSMYWMENKGFVISCILALAIVLIGFNGARIYKDHAEDALKAEFAAADEAGTLESFAKENSSKAIGGFAALTIADEAYQAKEFEKAAEFYQIASEALSDSILTGRALLGHAFALFNADQAETGLAKLGAIANNAELAESIRAEAAYHLAIEADLNGDSEAYEAYVTQINSSPLAGPWQQRLSQYQAQ